MVTPRAYFDADFAYGAKVHVRPQLEGLSCELRIIYDFAAYVAFLACYVPGEGRTLDEFLRLLDALHPGAQVVSEGMITLPSGRMFPGELQVVSANPVLLRAKFHGDPEWMISSEVPISCRLFLYSESALTDSEVLRLKERGRELGQRVQFRSAGHAEMRSRSERPMAFISHDSRDKDIAKQIAVGLQKFLCPVWYDEFSLPVGANLRDSIEGGLKSCKKCVLLLSPRFFANGGWTKREFDSIFTREILEEHQLVLPVWLDVTKEMVYNYSPSLLNVKGIQWQLGKDEVCRQLYNAVMDLSPLSTQWSAAQSFIA